MLDYYEYPPSPLELNSRQTPNVTWEYNCGGFALQSFDWYCPHSFDDYYQNTLEEGCEDAVYSEECLEDCVADILSSFGDALRVIDHPDESTGKVIGFRCGSSEYGEVDFHFIVRLPNGRWYQKCGGGDVETMTKRQALDVWDSGYYTYDGDVVWFEDTRSLN